MIAQEYRSTPIIAVCRNTDHGAVTKLGGTPQY
jgi:hypothetical protein